MGQKDDAKRIAVTLNLSERAQLIVKNIKEEAGMTQTAFLERLLEWYADQDSSVAREIREKNGDATGEMVRIKLAEMAGAGEEIKHLTFEKAIALARLSLSRLEAMGKTYRREAKGKSAGD